METLETSRVCRLCGKQTDISVDIFDKRGNRAKMINAVLPILIHKMDLLPKHICHCCNYKLEEFHKFYKKCLKTDADLKRQLSWMQRSEDREEINVPMVQISNINIKTEQPDDDEESVEATLNTRKFNNFMETDCTQNCETIVQSSGTKCSRWGCYCGNRNRSNDNISKNVSRTKTNGDSNVEKDNGTFPTRDTIRRNLFATQIFGANGPRIQTKIPICNIPLEMMNSEIALSRVNSKRSLERLRGQNGVDVTANHKMVEGGRKMDVRTLRPDKSAKSDSKLNSKTVVGVNESHTNRFKSIEIKMEVPEDVERSLRPRIETIDYSELKRKNSMANVDILPRRSASEGRIRKRKNFVDVSENSPEFNKSLTIPRRNTGRKIETDKMATAKTRETTNSDKNLNVESVVSSPMALIKLELKDIAKYNTKRQIDCQKIKMNYKKTKKLTEKTSKNWRKNCSQSSCYLRTRRSHLRNGQFKKFDLIDQKSNKSKQKSLLQKFSLESTKRQKIETKDRSLGKKINYRNCAMCNDIFASYELYKLHGCYADSRR